MSILVRRGSTTQVLIPSYTQLFRGVGESRESVDLTPQFRGRGIAAGVFCAARHAFRLSMGGVRSGAYIFWFLVGIWY